MRKKLKRSTDLKYFIQIYNKINVCDIIVKEPSVQTWLLDKIPALLSLMKCMLTIRFE